jgi:hypothetical protein
LLDDRRIQIRICISIIMDPDPGGPETYGSYGTLFSTLGFIIRNVPGMVPALLPTTTKSIGDLTQYGTVGNEL